MVVTSRSIQIAAFGVFIIDPSGLAGLASIVDNMETFGTFALESNEVVSVVSWAGRADSIDHEVVEVASAGLGE